MDRRRVERWRAGLVLCCARRRDRVERWCRKSDAWTGHRCHTARPIGEIRPPAGASQNRASCRRNKSCPPHPAARIGFELSLRLIASRALRWAPSDLLERVTPFVVGGVEFWEFVSDGCCFGRERFLSRCKWLDHDTADHVAPVCRFEVLVLTSQGLKRNADVK